MDSTVHLTADLAALGPPPKPVPAYLAGLPRDADGLLITPLWQPVPHKWARLPLRTRQSLSQGYEADLRRAAEKKPKVSRPGVTQYTTQYAIEHGRKKGWKLIDRENYNHRTKRTHDLQLGMDVMFDTPDGLVMVQAAGRGERKVHWERFMTRSDRGEKAKRRKIACFYWVFDRDSKTPIEEEQWA